MKILSMGCSFNHPSVDEFDFSSSASIFDYDILIWDPSKLVYDYSSYLDPYGKKFNGYPLFNETDSAKIQKDLARRKKELLYFPSFSLIFIISIIIPFIFSILIV